jgi:hypothetical protein
MNNSPGMLTNRRYPKDWQEDSRTAAGSTVQEIAFILHWETMPKAYVAAVQAM